MERTIDMINFVVRVSLTEFISDCTGVSLCMQACLLVNSVSVMTGSAVRGQIKMSSPPAHFHSHLSADLWEALRADTVHLFGPPWACLPGADPVS